MTIEDIEKRWESINVRDVSTYLSIRIDSTSIPELYLSLDVKGNRHLILQVPSNVLIVCNNIKMENLTLEWHEETRFILIGLNNSIFSDLFNEFTLSLYNRIKDISNPNLYTKEFINGFHKWADFFSEQESSLLTKNEIKGLFGELVVLNWLLKDNYLNSVEYILKAWVGPFGNAQDFNFNQYNLEVKTKDLDELYVSISSEYQLEVEKGKRLQIGIVNLKESDNGNTIEDLINQIKSQIAQSNSDVSIFLKTLWRAGLGDSNIKLYIQYKWLEKNIDLYDCLELNFPRLTSSNLHEGIKNVNYSINTTQLNDFQIQKIIL